MHKVYLSLGTNLGDKMDYLNQAIFELKKTGTIPSCSSVYQTPPWGFNSDDFYNIALELHTKLPAQNLIIELQKIEKSIGRKKDASIKGYQARVIDIDIIFYNDDIIKTENLIVPHPRMELRNFVLIPLVEIAAHFTHPVLKQTIHQLSKECKDDGDIKKLDLVLN